MKTIPKIIEEQVHRWQIMQKEEAEEKEGISIVTISREPGSGGRIVASSLADKLSIDIFHQEVINKIDKSANPYIASTDAARSRRATELSLTNLC